MADVLNIKVSINGPECTFRIDIQNSHVLLTLVLKIHASLRKKPEASK